MDNSQKSLIVFVFLLMLSNWHCYEHEEGCKDVRATNYSVSADDPCEDCCKYPPLILQFSHVRGQETIDTNYIWESPRPFRIRSLNFYLSGFTLEEGQIHDDVSIEETIEILPMDAPDQNYLPVVFPVAKINLGRTSSYTLGTFRHADVYGGLRLDFGLEETVNHARMDRIPGSSALYQNQDSMYINQESGFYFLKMDLDFPDEDEKNIRILGDAHRISLNFMQDFDFSERENRVFSLTLDYEQWFESVDFWNEPEEMIVAKLLNNLEKAMTID
jgi:hypothetical protein